MAHGKSLQLRYIGRPQPTVLFNSRPDVAGRGVTATSSTRRARKAEQLDVRRAARRRAVANGLGGRA